MKKITAIVLCVLLAMSALVVLTACGTTEYVVTFREYNSKIIYQGKTINGKAVECRQPTRQGYKFDGWYKSLTGDADGNLVYAEPMDFDKNVESDLDLYAKWNKIGGEAEGYCIIGDAVGNWDPAKSTLSDRMTQDSENPNLYVKEMTVDKGKGFKVKTFYPDWDTPEINYGGDKVGEITMKSDIVLPTGIADAKGLFDNSNNITPLVKMNLKVTFNYGTKKIDLYVNSIDVPASGEEAGYTLVGSMQGWNNKTEDETYKFTGDATNPYLYTLTTDLAAGVEFKIATFQSDWKGAVNLAYGAIKKVSWATGATIPAVLENANDLIESANGKADGNIKTTAAVNVTISFNFLFSTVEIVVNNVTVA